MAGDNASTTSLSLAAGATAAFGTGSVPAFLGPVNLGASTMVFGSARSVATSKSLVCNAFAADSQRNAPASMMHLTIVAEAKQKAAN